MNGYMNINVRVISAQAQAQIKALQKQVGMLEAELAKAGRASGSDPLGGARGRKTMAAWGNQIQWTGRQLTYNWTLPLALAGGAATKFALDNEKAFTHIKKVYGDTTDAAEQFNKEAGKSADALYGQQKAAKVFNNELEALQGSFVALSNRYGVAQKDVLETASAWAAAGQSGVALAESTQLSIKAAVLGDMDLAKATDALISIQAQYGESTKELNLTLNELNAIENQTGISMQGLIDGFTRTAGVARESGIDVRHLGAMLAALVPATGSAATAGNALKTIISRIMSPTKDAADVMKEFGVNTSTAFWQSNTAMDRLMILADHMNGTLQKTAKGGYALSDSQKQVVASVLGSRYQMNRFLVLMRELGPEYSYYEKALNATSDRTKVFAQAQQELNAVLKSNPQRLKIIWTTLQNGMATAVQPLIPYIIYLAQQVASLVNEFTKLDPSVQKLILTFGVLLALVGPVTKYFGSLMTLIGIMVMPLKFLRLQYIELMTVQTVYNGVTETTRLTLLGLFSTMLMAPFKFMTRGFIALFGVIKGFGYAWVFLSQTAMVSSRALVLIWTSTWAMLKAVWVVGMTSLRVLSAGWALWEVGLFTKLGAALRVVSTMTWSSLVIVYRAGMAALMVVMGTGFKAMGQMFLRFGAVLLGPWGIAIAAVIAIFIFFHRQITQIWDNTLSYFSDSTNAMTQLVINAWNSLPGAVTNALVAVARVVQQAAMAIYNWFSYINPFAHHSPSLVENVTKGTDIIADKFKGMGKSVSGSIKGAYADIKRFKNATKNLIGQSNSYAEHQDRQKIKKYEPGALGAFDALSKKLKELNVLLAHYKKLEDAQQAVVDRWQAKVDAMNRSLDVQQAKLDKLQKVQDKWSDALQTAQDRLEKFASAPIKGMKAMNDAIFDNDQAQKALQLQMMQMEDVTGPLDDIKSKMDAINGAQEMLRGDQAALRSAGAGSNILSFYDDQIKALDDQKVAQTGAASALQDMNDQLDALQRKGQELDLENSLQFDPLTKQIEEAANAMKELPFDVIMKGVQGAQADITVYQAKLDAATAAVKRQQDAVDAITKKRDALQARLDKENYTLKLIKDKYDKINDAVQDVTQAMSDAASAADALDQAASSKKKKKKTGGAGYVSPAVQNFRDAAKGNFPVGGGDGIPIRTDWSDQTAKINKFTQRISDQAAKAFDNINPFDAIKKKWPAFKGWFTDRWEDTSAAVSDMFGHMFKGVGGSGENSAADKFRIAWAKTVDWFNEHVVKNLKKVWALIWPSIHEFLTNLMHGFHEFWKQISPELKKWAPLFKQMGGALKGIWTIAKPILSLLAGEFLLLIKIILSIAAKAIYPLLQLLGNVLENLLQMVRGVLQVIIGFLTIFSGNWRQGLTEMKEGVLNIVNGLFGAIGQLIKGAVKLILAIIWGFVKGIYDFFVWLFEKMIGHSIIPDLINGIFKWFHMLVQLPKWIWQNVLKPIYEFFRDLWNKYVRPALSMWWSGIKAEWNALKTAAAWMWNNVLQPIWGKVKDLWTNVRQGLAAWWEGIKGAWKALTNLGDWFKNNVMDPVFNVVKSGWNNIKNWLVENKDMLMSPMKTIANSIIGAVDTVINGLNKISDVLPGPINWHISPIDKMASGGAVARRSANRGFKTNGARAIVGEGKANYPEFVIPTDPTYRKRAKGLMAAAYAKMGYRNGENLRGAFGDMPKDISNVAANSTHDAYGALPQFGLGGWLSGNFHKATGFFKGKAKDLISKAVNPALNKAESTIKGVGWNAIEPPPLYGISQMRNWLNDANSQYNTANTKAQDKISGGPKVRKALNFAKAQVGDPYTWGAVGPDGYDCSGFMSALTNVLRGKSPYSRVGTTGTFPWGGFSSGVGPNKGFTIGSTKSYAGGVGHMAGTLGGINVESRGGVGPIVGGGARGYSDPGFNTHAYLPLKEGGIALRNRGPVLAAMGDGRYDEAVVPLPKGFRDNLIGSGGGDTVVNINGNLSFPNITSGDDAKAFIDNLESIAKD